MDEDIKKFSIQLRVRRVIHEDAYIAVPATGRIVEENAEGKGSIDFDAFVAEAIRLSQSEGVDWQVEKTEIEAHPMQNPRPEDRRLFNGYDVSPYVED